MSSNLPHPAFGGIVGAQVYEDLLLPGKEPVRATMQLAASQTLLKGHILGAITASGKLIISLSAASDGSEVPIAIMTEDLVVGGSDKLYDVYVEGMFNENALVYGSAHDANTVRIALRKVGIYLSVPKYSYL